MFSLSKEHAPAPPRIYDLEEMCERSGVLEIRLVRPEGRGLLIRFSDHLGFRKAGESDAGFAGLGRIRVLMVRQMMRVRRTQQEY